MKIALPVNGNFLESGICQSFGRCPYYLIYNLDLDKIEYTNNSASSSQGGAGVKAAQIIADNEINAVIVPQCGENAAVILKAADIKIYKTINDSIADNISAFKEDRLNLLEEIHAGFHNHGGN